MEILSFDFMQRALLAGLIVAISCPLIGVFLVVRRQSMIGDGLGHIAFAGVVAGWIFGYKPVASAALFTTLGALAIERVRSMKAEFSEMILAIFFYAGMGIAVVLSSLPQAGGFNLSSFLFGSIMTVSTEDLYWVAGLGILNLLFVLLFYRPLVYVSFDESSARVSGIPVAKLNLLLSILTALNVAIAMRVVGILLVSSLLVIPVACALQVAKSFSQTMLWATVYSLLGVLLGLSSSYYLDFAPGGMIVLLLVAAFFITTLCANIFRKNTLLLQSGSAECACGFHHVECDGDCSKAECEDKP